MFGPKSKVWAEMYDKYVVHTYATLPVVLDGKSGKGTEIWDMDGKKYLDFWAGYSALNLGHYHPRTWSVLKKSGLVTRACYEKNLALLGEKISELVGFDSMILPKNSGVEGVESAIKTVRMWAYRTKRVSHNQGEIIVMNRNFHGRTISVVSFSSEEQYKNDFGPHTPGFILVDYGDIKNIEKAVTKKTIAILMEPMQGEGGIIIPPKNYLKDVRSLCDKYEILLILDEIQTGLGRTGKMFCCEHNEIKPDLLILGKSLCGGTPAILSLVVGSREIMKLWQPGDDGSTFGGNSAAAAVALETFNVLAEEKLIENSAELGEYFKGRLKAINHSLIKEVRGKGLFIGIEFFSELGGARKIVNKLIEEGIICKEAHCNVLRLSPPLVITKEQLDFFLKKFQKVLREIL